MPAVADMLKKSLLTTDGVSLEKSISSLRILVTHPETETEAMKLLIGSSLTHGAPVGDRMVLANSQSPLTQQTTMKSIGTII